MKKVTALIFLFLVEVKADIPAPWNNKVAYYVFDSHGPDHFPLTSFTDEANIVVVFEGALWELADSIHYDTGWMKNVVYKYKSEIIRDIKELQARGVKVLMNVDDHAAWDTPTPFTTYDSVKLNAQQFAAFIKACAIDSLQLDGISLDIEHKATGTADYITLLKEIGKYFGPKSDSSNSQMYIAAIYAGYWGQPASVIGKSKDVSSYFNFVMDMAYFNSNYVGRFNQWADSIGASKTMIGVLNDNNDLNFTTSVAAWQPSSSHKAGIMVYAANNLKSYTDSVFRSLVMPVTEVADREEVLQEFALLQNYPNPFNPTTTISFSIPHVGTHENASLSNRTSFQTSLRVYDMLGREIETLVNEIKEPGNYKTQFNASKLSSGIYFYTLQAGSYIQTKKMLLVK